MSNNLLELLKLESETIDSDFKRASIEGQGTPQEVSDRRESSLTKILRKYFPFPYRLAKGNIRDSYGNNSMSIDCILLNPQHPFTVSEDNKYSVILADGVDIAIELKPSLDSQSEIERSLNQITSVKNLKRKTDNLIDSSHSQIYKNNCKLIPSVIFSNKTYKKEELLIEKILCYYEKNKTKREKQFDIIVVNNSFLIINNKKDNYLYLKNKPEGFILFHSKELTFALFMLFLNKLPQSTIRLDKPIINYYLSDDIQVESKTFSEINKRLMKI